MAEHAEFRTRYRLAIVAGASVVIALQVALVARGRSAASEESADAAPRAQLLQLPETDAPLRDAAEILTPEPADDPSPRPRAEATFASLPSVPRLADAASRAMDPVMFMEEIDQPETSENPAVTYASASDFLIAASPEPRALRPIDDRPVEVLATVGSSRWGRIGGDGPHCLPSRPRMLQRSGVVSGVPSRILTPRM